MKDFKGVVEDNLGGVSGGVFVEGSGKKGSSVNEKVRGRFSFEHRADLSLKGLNSFDALFAMTEAMVTYTMQIARMAGATEDETDALKAKLAQAPRGYLADPEKAPLPFVIPEMYEILHQKAVVEPVFTDIVAMHQAMQDHDRQRANERLKSLLDRHAALEIEHKACEAAAAKFSHKRERENLEECERETRELTAKVSARLMAIASNNPQIPLSDAQAIADADSEILQLNEAMDAVEWRRIQGSPKNEKARTAMKRLDEIDNEIAQIEREVDRIQNDMEEFLTRSAD
jgi:hypothetical protein